MNRPAALSTLGLLLLGAAALVPLRHRVTVEQTANNPVQHLLVESRSLLGLRPLAWGLQVTGAEAWGNAREGFFLAPRGEVQVVVKAWPNFRQSLSIRPTSSAVVEQGLTEADRLAFRTWFVALLEQQLEGPSPAWEPAQRDCAGFLRFAFREAWGPHTEAWKDRVGFKGSAVAGDPDIRRAGPWRRAFPTPEGWQPFAKGSLLRDQACVKVGREVALARPGDLACFARGGARNQPDHLMAFVRPDTDGQPVLIYHTGPEGSAHRPAKPGEVRRVRLDELLHHPEPDYRPLPENPAFLGIFRWKVLADSDLLSRE